MEMFVLTINLLIPYVSVFLLLLSGIVRTNLTF